jgi:hypothetical protein
MFMLISKIIIFSKFLVYNINGIDYNKIIISTKTIEYFFIRYFHDQ